MLSLNTSNTLHYILIYTVILSLQAQRASMCSSNTSPKSAPAMVSLANLVQKKTAVGTRAPSQPITGLPLSCDIYCWNWEETVFLCLSNIFLCIAIKSCSMLLLLIRDAHSYDKQSRYNMDGLLSRGLNAALLRLCSFTFNSWVNNYLFQSLYV